MRITQYSVDQIFDSINIELYRQLLPDLKKSGSGWKCNSPFTDEKTPSFHVWKNGTLYKDFSSGKGGTFIDLLMNLKQMSYPEALKYTADAAGIIVETEGKPLTPEEIDKTKRLNNCLSKTIEAWQKNLHTMPEEHPAWQELMNHRQYDEPVVDAWGLGLAPDSWQWAWGNLREKGYYTVGLELGIIIEKTPGKIFDAMRNRIVFPIHDHNGNLISFAGRIIPDEKPKYINGPNSPLYDKSNTLYGLHLAKESIRETGNAYLVEGYFDVISMHRAGMENTVATCGTALSADQIRLLKRYTSRVTIMRDQDQAGIKASMRDFQALIAHGLEVHICQLPDGMDPDEFCRVAERKEDQTETVEAIEV